MIQAEEGSGAQPSACSGLEGWRALPGPNLSPADEAYLGVH